MRWRCRRRRGGSCSWVGSFVRRSGGASRIGRCHSKELQSVGEHADSLRLFAFGAVPFRLLLKPLRLGDLHGLLRERYGDKVEVKAITGERGFLRRRLGMAAGGALADLPGATVAAIEERLLWSRFGL